MTFIGLYVTDLGKGCDVYGTICGQIWEKDVTFMGLVHGDIDQVVDGRRQVLKKHVATIHRSNDLSLLQGKISNALLYHAYHDLMTKEEHQISVSTLCKIIGYGGHNHDVIKEALKALVARVVEWNLIDEQTNAEDWNASSILASVRIKGAVCSYAYSPRMRDLLFNPAVYGRINMIVQARFKSSYGLALYENCVRYRGLPYTRWFTLDMFRKLMGVGEGKYPIFRDFKRRVLDKAIDEVNTFSDLKIQSELYKMGWLTVKVRFKISERTKKSKIGLQGNRQNQQPSDDKFESLLVEEFAITHSAAKKIIESYGPEYVKKKIDYVKKSTAFTSGNIKNIASYLISALHQDYKHAPSSSEIQMAEIIEKRKEEEHNNLRHKLNKRREEDYERYVSKMISEKIDSLDSSLSEEVRKRFTEEMLTPGNPVIFDSYKKRGFDSMIVRSMLIVFVKCNYPKVVDEIGLMEFEQFCQEQTA